MKLVAKVLFELLVRLVTLRCLQISVESINAGHIDIVFEIRECLCLLRVEDFRKVLALVVTCTG